MPWSSRYSWTLRLEFLIPLSPNLDDKVFQILDSNEDHGRGNIPSIISWFSSFDTAWTSFPRSQRIRTVPSIFCTPLECFCCHTASMVQILRDWEYRLVYRLSRDLSWVIVIENRQEVLVSVERGIGVQAVDHFILSKSNSDFPLYHSLRAVRSRFFPL